METCGVVKELENLCLHKNSIVGDRALGILCDYFDSIGSRDVEIEIAIPGQTDFIFS